MGIVPSSKPRLSKADVQTILKKKNIDRDKYPVCVLAVRGYYLNSMGKKNANDRGIYDDAAFIDSPTAFVSVNFNTDPSSYRKGSGKGSGKGMATLKCGVWDYKIGPHKGKSPACRQAEKVIVVRDGLNGDYEDFGYFGINHHWGGRGTSSAGCQTVPPNQWPSYINTLVGELKRYKQKVFKYVLITEAEREELLNENDSQNDALPTKGEPMQDAVNDQEFDSRPESPSNLRNLEPGLEVIKEFEGCRLQAYRDPVGIPTIGWGSTRYPDGIPVRMGDWISQDQADEMLLIIANRFAEDVERLVKVIINNNEFCALVSFAYNVGAGALGSSTLLRKLNGGSSRMEVANEFDRWVKAGGKTLKGLVRRRTTEKKLFLSY